MDTDTDLPVLTTLAVVEDPPVDTDASAIPGGDIVVVFVAWGLTQLLKDKVGPWVPKLRSVLPLVAVLIATFAYATADTIAGVPFSFDVIGKGVLAGATAVLAHSQIREIFKPLDATTPDHNAFGSSR